MVQNDNFFYVLVADRLTLSVEFAPRSDSVVVSPTERLCHALTINGTAHKRLRNLKI